MRTELQKLVSLTKFVAIKQFSKMKMVIDLEKPSRILVQNIYYSWLKSIHGKTVQHFPIYMSVDVAQKYQKSCYGYINQQSTNIKEILIDHNKEECRPINNVNLKLNLVVPQLDIMQFFIQWQRYRKYWWSSITTTPSLFTINDMKHGVESSDVNIVANFDWGTQIVETISINANGSQKTNNISTSTSSLTCTMGLETALLTLLLDGLSNATKEEYLRLHNKIAPYKISFGLDSEGVNEDNQKDLEKIMRAYEKILSTLKELAQLLFYKLGDKQISGWLPAFAMPLQLQIKENLQMGVTYTAILNENTLTNGIFHLLNSSTMLKEQVHVADFDSYAALLCGKH